MENGINGGGPDNIEEIILSEKQRFCKQIHMLHDIWTASAQSYKVMN